MLTFLFSLRRMVFAAVARELAFSLCNLMLHTLSGILGGFENGKHVFGEYKKAIPKNFEECYKTDKVTYNLWVWAERLERWGFRICIFMASIGAIQAILIGLGVSEFYDAYNMTPEYDSVLVAVFVCLVSWAFYCFLEFCAYHILALLVGSLATIVQNTKITANVALYMIATRIA